MLRHKLKLITSKILFFLLVVLLVVIINKPLIALAVSVTPPNIAVDIPGFTGEFEKDLVERPCFGGALMCVVIPWIGQYHKAIYQFAVWSAGILAVAIITFGGIVWLIAGGNPNRYSQAKNYIFSGIIGLLLLLSSVFLLRTINPATIDTTELSFPKIRPKSFEFSASGDKACEYDSDCPSDQRCVTQIVGRICAKLVKLGEGCAADSNTGRDDLCDNTDKSAFCPDGKTICTITSVDGRNVWDNSKCINPKGSCSVLYNPNALICAINYIGNHHEWTCRKKELQRKSSSCSKNFHCPLGFYCKRIPGAGGGLTAEGSCEPALTENTACDQGALCAANLVCRENINKQFTCQPKLQERSACKKNEDCVDQLVCRGTLNDRTCLPPADAGGPCNNNDDSHCRVGLVCNMHIGACHLPGKLNASCYDSDDCIEILSCRNKQCVITYD